MRDLHQPSRGVWPTVPLGELCTIVIGRTPSRNRPDFWGGNHPWLSIADMNQGRCIRTTKEKISSLGVSESGSKLIPAGTVLLSFKLSIGKVAVSDIDTYTNEAIAALLILDPEKLVRDFLFWSLRSIRLDEEIDFAAKGKTLNKAKLERLEIPLPPLDEQRRIAAVLDKADTLRRHRQESLQLTERLLQSVFIDMFGDPGRNPKSWHTLPLEELCEKIVDCPHSTPVYADTPTGFYCVRSSDIQNAKLDLASTRHVSEAVFTERIARHEPKGGEVIYTREGGRLGFAAQVPPGKRICLGQRMMLFKAKGNVATNTFLANLLNSEPFRRKVLNLVGGGAAPRINIKDLRAIMVYQPPFELQQQFERFADKLIETEAALIQSEAQTRRLFASLQQRAFRRELDLSRLKLDVGTESPAAAPAPDSVSVQSRYKRPGSFIPPADVEAQMNLLEDRLDAGKGDSIPWDENYFKYRILSQVLEPPFSFSDIWTEVEYDIDTPSYEVVKDKVFEYVKDGILQQRFDEVRREIVFYPRP